MDGWKEKKQRMGLLMGGSQRPFYLAEVPQHITHHRIDQCLPPLPVRQRSEWMYHPPVPPPISISHWQNASISLFLVHPNQVLGRSRADEIKSVLLQATMLKKGC